MKNEKNLVSVLIASYNHEKYIAETIESIINQTYPNIELLVLDDGSKDRTFEILESLREKCEKRFTRVDISRQENAGICVTLNRNAEKAKGEFIYIIASDDAAKPDAIAKEVEFLTSHPEHVIVTGNNEFFDGESKPCGWTEDYDNAPYDTAKYKTFAEAIRATRPDVDMSGESFGRYDSLVRGHHIPNGYLIRKDAFVKAGCYQKDAPWEDWYIFMQLAKLGKFGYIDEVLFKYRQHPTNTTKLRDHMRQMRKKTAIFELRNLLKEEDNPFLDEFMTNIPRDVFK